MNQTLGYARCPQPTRTPISRSTSSPPLAATGSSWSLTSGARAERPQLAQALDDLRSGDTLVVWILDRLARSLRDLIDLVTTLEE
jgi:hypothetical protein